jgi:hypothetical protein
MIGQARIAVPPMYSLAGQVEENVIFDETTARYELLSVRK